MFHLRYDGTIVSTRLPLRMKEIRQFLSVVQTQRLASCKLATFASEICDILLKVEKLILGERGVRTSQSARRTPTRSGHIFQLSAGAVAPKTNTAHMQHCAPASVAEINGRQSPLCALVSLT